MIPFPPLPEMKPPRTYPDIIYETPFEIPSANPVCPEIKALCLSSNIPEEYDPKVAVITPKSQISRFLPRKTPTELTRVFKHHCQSTADLVLDQLTNFLTDTTGKVHPMAIHADGTWILCMINSWTLLEEHQKEAIIFFAGEFHLFANAWSDMIKVFPEFSTPGDLMAQ